MSWKLGLPIIEDTTIKNWKMFQKIFLKIKIWMKFEYTTKGFGNKVWIIPNKLFLFVFSNSSIIIFGVLVRRAKYTILETAKLLKITILSSIVSCFIIQNFKTPCIFDIAVKFFFSIAINLLYEKCIPKIFMVSIFRLICFVPQDCHLDPFQCTHSQKLHI